MLAFRLVPRAAALSVACLLAACASQPAADKPSETAATARQIETAATTPLTDLNLVRAKIPEALKAARQAPYAPPQPAGCPALLDAVKALDAALGPDLDTPATPDDPSLVERGGEVVQQAAVGAVRGAAEDVVPFRGWVRRLTGAERHSREVAAAIAAGTIRRAYLKGLGDAAGCPVPAAPRR